MVKGLCLWLSQETWPGVPLLWDLLRLEGKGEGGGKCESLMGLGRRHKPRAPRLKAAKVGAISTPLRSCLYLTSPKKRLLVHLSPRFVPLASLSDRSFRDPSLHHVHPISASALLQGSLSCRQGPIRPFVDQFQPLFMTELSFQAFITPQG